MPIQPDAIQREVDRVQRLIRSTAAAIGIGIMMLQISLIALIIIIWTGTENLNQGNQARSEVTRSQISCFNVVQGNYIARLGALAETGNRQMLGEPTNIEDTRRALADLEAANALLRQLDQLCYTNTPDRTPLDGDPNR
jgi:hypothetical protein